MSLATITIHTEKGDIGPLAVTYPVLNDLHDWLYTGKVRAYSLHAQLPPKVSDDTSRYGVIVLMLNKVLGMTVENARLGLNRRLI